MNVIEEVERAFQMMHFGCDNDDHREAYLIMARALDYLEMENN